MTTYQIIYAWGDFGPDSVTGKWGAHTFMDGHAEPYVPLAAVAAAYEAAAECALGDKTKLEEARVKSHLTYLVMQRDNIALSIRDLTPADALAALERERRKAKNEALEELGPLAILLPFALAEADKAMRKFPQPNYVISKWAEETGEVTKAAIHYAEDRCEVEDLIGEIIQSLAMLHRLIVEGDMVHGSLPFAAAIRAMKEPEDAQC